MGQSLLLHEKGNLRCDQVVWSFVLVCGVWSFVLVGWVGRRVGWAGGWVGGVGGRMGGRVGVWMGGWAGGWAGERRVHMQAGGWMGDVGGRVDGFQMLLSELPETDNTT